MGGTGGIEAGSVHDAMEVVANLDECMFRSSPFKITELVDATALHSRARPELLDGTA